MNHSNKVGLAYTHDIEASEPSTTIAASTPDCGAGEVDDCELQNDLRNIDGNKTGTANSRPVKPPAKSFGQRIGELVASGEHFASDDGGKLYRFVKGRYVTRADQFIKGRAKSITSSGILRAQWSTANVENVVGWIAADAPNLQPPVPEYINLANGLLRLNDRKLLPHDAKYLTTVQLPVEYDRAATCPDIEECIGQWFPADALPLAYEIPAYLAVPITSIQKAVLLLGAGANGKSRYLEMIRRFLGPRNVANLSLHFLESNRFASARLVGKLANICADLPSEHLSGTSFFKAATGGDELPAERKFKESFEFHSYCRLVFSANHPPVSKDSSAAFFRRWLPIPFDNTFTVDPIPHEILDARLSTPSEQSGLLNHALDHLEHIKGRNMQFHTCESTETAMKEFHEATDHFTVWMNEHTIDDPDAIVSCDQLLNAYNDDAGKHGQRRLTKAIFGTRVRQLTGAERKQRLFQGRYQTWCYLGIGLKFTDQIDD